MSSESTEQESIRETIEEVTAQVRAVAEQYIGRPTTERAQLQQELQEKLTELIAYHESLEERNQEAENTPADLERGPEFIATLDGEEVMRGHSIVHRGMVDMGHGSPAPGARVERGNTPTEFTRGPLDDISIGGTNVTPNTDVIRETIREELDRPWRITETTDMGGNTIQTHTIRADSPFTPLRDTDIVHGGTIRTGTISVDDLHVLGHAEPMSMGWARTRTPKRYSIDTDKINNTMDMIQVFRAICSQMTIDEKTVKEFGLEDYVIEK